MIYNFCYELIKIGILILIIHSMYKYIKNTLKEIIYVSIEDFNIVVKPITTSQNKTKKTLFLKQDYYNSNETTSIHELNNINNQNNKPDIAQIQSIPTIQETPLTRETQLSNKYNTDIKNELIDYINNEFISEK